MSPAPAKHAEKPEKTADGTEKKKDEKEEEVTKPEVVLSVEDGSSTNLPLPVQPSSLIANPSPHLPLSSFLVMSGLTRILVIQANRWFDV